MGILDTVKDAVTGNKDHHHHSGTDKTVLPENYSEVRAKQRAEESAKLGGQNSHSIGSSSTTSGLTGTTGTGIGSTTTHGNTIGSTHGNTIGSNTSGTIGTSVAAAGAALAHEHSAQRAVPQSERADYSDVPGHEHRHQDAAIDPTAANVTNKTSTLAAVTHENIRRTEVEEVERLRNVDRHVTHVQVHEQPILDKQVNAEQHHQNIVPVTNVTERHAPPSGEAALLASQVGQHRDTVTQAPVTRQIVDLGERVNTTVHHTVENVVQPIIEREVVDQHRIHTQIPIQHTEYAAPIVHQVSRHEPLSMAEFTKAGGELSSGVSHMDISNRVLNTDNCERVVDGPAETLARSLGLGHNTTGATAAANAPRAA